MTVPMDESGRTRLGDYTAEEIAAFTESEAERLATLLECEKELNAAEDQMHSTTLAEADMIKADDKFRREGNKKFPPPTPHEAYMAVLRATSPSHAPSQQAPLGPDGERKPEQQTPAVSVPSGGESIA